MSSTLAYPAEAVALGSDVPVASEVASALGFPGLLASSKAGAKHHLWSDRHGGFYLIPSVTGDTNRDLRRFADAYPALRLLNRLLRPMKGPEALKLSIDAIDHFVRKNVPFDGRLQAPAFRIAVPGAYRKIVAVIDDSVGRRRAYVKLPANHGGAMSIRRETRILGVLEKLPEVAHAIPRRLGGETESDSLPVLALEGGPVSRGPRRFGRKHRRFLDSLLAATAHQCSLEDSAILRRWKAQLAVLKTDATWRVEYDVLRRAVERVGNRLAGRRITLSMAHGDFVKWNTRSGFGSLYVFDWEKALGEAVPGFDAFFFDNIPRLLRGQSIRGPRQDRWLRGMLRDAGVSIDMAWLSFLIEVGLHYAEARVRCPEEGNDRIVAPVIREAARRIA